MASPTRRLGWTLMIAIAAIGSNSLALSPVLGDVARDLGSSTVEVARASAAYGGATAASALLFGTFIDRVGPRWSLMIALAGLAVAIGASATVMNWWALAAAQAVAGVCAGVALPATYAMATASAPEGRSAETLGRVLSGWSISLVAGVPIFAALAEITTWRGSYALLSILLAGACFGVGRAAAPGPVRTAPGHNGLLAALRGRNVAKLLGICLAYMTAFYGVYAYLGDYARRSLDLTAAQAGLLVLAYGLGFGLASFGDRFVDRIGARRSFAPALGGIAAVYAALALAPASFVGLFGLAAAWGCANHYGLNILVLLLTRAALDRLGATLALNSAVSYAGALIGAGLFGPFYERFGFAFLAGAASLALGTAAFAAVTLERGSAAAPPRMADADAEI